MKDLKEYKKLNAVRFDENYKKIDQVKKLYHDSFPDSERKPFSMILDGIDSGKMSGWIFECNSQPEALAFVIHGQHADVLDYLAVDPKIRGNGLGSRIISFLMDELTNSFFVEIESTRKDPADEKIRRKSFYLRNGFKVLDDQIDLFGVTMELLSSPEPLQLSDYMETMEEYFEQEVTEWIKVLQDE